MLLRLRHIHKVKDRFGKVRLYYRQRGHKTIRLPERADPNFHAAYAAAAAASAPKAGKSRVIPGSMEDLARSYMGSAHFKQLGDSTRSVYRRILAELMRKHGHRLARDLEARRVRAMLDERSDTPAAANHLLRTLRALMRHAVRMGLRDDDPTKDIERLKERGEGAETWTEEDIAKFEAHWPAGSKPRLAFALLLYTGQRRSDVVRMGRQHLRSGAIEVRQVKTGAKLLIPLHPDLAELLETEPRDRLTFLMSATDPPKPYSSNGFYMRFKEWTKAAGLENRSPHGLRKAAARRLAEGGCTAHQIAAVTGHKTLGEVQRYTIAADQQRLAREAVARMKPEQVSVKRLPKRGASD